MQRLTLPVILARRRKASVCTVMIPRNQMTTLTLQGEILVEIEVDPPQLYLGRVRRGEETVRSVDILYDANKPIAITK